MASTRAKATMATNNRVTIEPSTNAAIKNPMSAAANSSRATIDFSWDNPSSDPSLAIASLRPNRFEAGDGGRLGLHNVVSKCRLRLRLETLDYDIVHPVTDCRAGMTGHARRCSLRAALKTAPGASRTSPPLSRRISFPLTVFQSAIAVATVDGGVRGI